MSARPGVKIYKSFSTNWVIEEVFWGEMAGLGRGLVGSDCTASPFLYISSVVSEACNSPTNVRHDPSQEGETKFQTRAKLKIPPRTAKDRTSQRAFFLIIDRTPNFISSVVKTSWFRRTGSVDPMRERIPSFGDSKQQGYLSRLDKYPCQNAKAKDIRDLSWVRDELRLEPCHQRREAESGHPAY